MISSTHNPKIQSIRALQTDSHARREQGAFVVEGTRLVEEALHAGWEARLVIHTSDLTERGQRIIDSYAQRGAPLEEVAPHVMRAASDTQSPQGILAVLAITPLEIPPSLDFIFIPDGVRDPGNMGALLRTAAAAGVEVVFLPPECVDPYAPKVVRAGMGAHFRLPMRTLSWGEIADLTHGMKAYLAAAQEGIPYTQVDFRQHVVLIVGGEASGAGVHAQELAIARVHIPMPGGSESLNTAVAGAILMYEVVRQRGRSANGNRKS